MTRKECWFKIWLTGNGGIEHSHRYVYWEDLDDNECEMSSMIERELGPFSSGIRSCHWEQENPPKQDILEHVEYLRRLIQYRQKEIDTHLALIDNCEIPTCKGGGVPGNENVIDGKRVCDYCHAEMMENK